MEAWTILYASRFLRVQNRDSSTQRKVRVENRDSPTQWKVQESGLWFMRALQILLVLRALCCQKNESWKDLLLFLRLWSRMWHWSQCSTVHWQSHQTPSLYEETRTFQQMGQQPGSRFGCLHYTIWRSGVLWKWRRGCCRRGLLSVFWFEHWQHRLWQPKGQRLVVSLHTWLYW